MKPSFITYTAFLPASPAERLAAAAAAYFSQKTRFSNAWLWIAKNDHIYIGNGETIMGTHTGACCFAQVTDRGQGPEICMEFYNCDPPPSKDHGDGHGDETW